MVDRGLVPSRERAQALILAGKVLVNEQKVEKSGTAVSHDSALRLLGEDLRYVSRGGLKLEHALAHWNIDVTGRTCLDIGASTGGFTDCMLQNCAAHVIAIDTGYGQIDMKFRNDPRVSLLEKTNARHLETAQLAPSLCGTETISFLAMDVSFISATLVLPPVVKAVNDFRKNGSYLEAVILVKPQFEVGRELVGKGGIVRDSEAQAACVEKVRQCVIGLGAAFTDVTDSPILGTEGNREFLLYARFEKKLTEEEQFTNR